jgi:hypothetical protein
VRPHGRPSFFRIVGLGCGQNAFVMELPALRPAIDSENSQPLLPQKTNN